VSTETTARQIQLGDLLDTGELAAMLDEGYVRRQVHPSMPLAIYNYTEKAAYDRAWNDVTRQCRGLIVDTATTAVIARPFPKFFNYGEHDEATLSLDEPVIISDKMDGSLGIVYRGTDGKLAVATRGSFASEQAVHATRVLRERYPDFEPLDGYTELFEIVYPQNRIVLDYGAADDLFYLGSVHIATGRSFGPYPPGTVAANGKGWTGPRASVFEGRTLADALAMPPRANAEGIVVHYHGSDLRVKIKQDDYVALHRILTMTTARTVWEYLAVDACRHLITAPKHWGSRLAIDPARAAEILAVGPDWLVKLTDGVPDEFHGWLRTTIGSLRLRVSGERSALEAQAAGLRTEHGGDRKAFAQAVSGHPHAGALFLMLDGRDITTYLWKSAYPPPEKAWGARSEDVA
jgi:putative RNA ligase